MKNTLLISILFFINISCKNTSNDTKSEKEIKFKEIVEKSINQELFLEKELKVFRNLEEGIERAKTEKKPIFLHFTAHSLPLKNKVKSNILLKNQNTFELLKNNYINVWLYIDDKDNGDKWFKYQKNNFKYIAQPYFGFLNFNGVILSEGLDYGNAYRNLEKELKKHI